MSAIVERVSRRKHGRVHPWHLARFLAFLALFIAIAAFRVRAQSDEGLWVDPVNLSHSGAASAPTVVVRPDGGLRVLWWDEFDGVTVVEGTADGWSEPAPAPIVVLQERPQGGPQEPVYVPIASMPRIVGDADGRAHAFWLAEPDEETGARALLHSRLALGSTSWSQAEVVAESATRFDVAVDPSGAIHLAYIRWLHTATLPAGVYYRRSADGGASWTVGRSLDASRYYRLLSAEDAHLRVDAGDAGEVYVTWDDPRLARAMLAGSADGGETWEEPTAVGGEDQQPRRGRLAPVPGGDALLLWEDARIQGMCGLYQAPASELMAGTEGEEQRALEGLAACPADERFLPLGEGQVLMVAGSGDGALTLAAWDGRQWSSPRALNVEFADPAGARRVQLQSPQALLAPSLGEDGASESPRLIVVGTDEDREVWVARSQEAAVELASAPPASTQPVPPGGSTGPGQAEPLNLSHSGAASLPAIVALPDGTLRAFWWDAFEGLMSAQGIVSVSPVMSGTQEVQEMREAWSEPKPMPLAMLSPTAAPRFLADTAGSVHAFWLEAGDEGIGPLMHSRLAAGAVSWSSPVVLAESAVRFDIAADARGGLHLAYVRTQHTPDVPAGVYYRRSTDGGAIWDAPTALDASRYYRLLVPEDAHVRVAAGSSGRVYVTWDDPRLERAMLASSPDSGAAWQAARTLGGPDEQPRRARLAPVSGGDVLVLWEDARLGGGCILYQVPASEWIKGEQDSGQRVLEGLASCSGDEQFLPAGEGQLLLVEGSGSDALTVAAWDGEQWSEPRRLGFRFEDPEFGEQVYLQDLDVALVQGAVDAAAWTGKALVAAGTDGQGDVWVTPGYMGALEMVFAPPSPWSAPVSLSQGDGVPGLPAVAADKEGNVHVLWSETETAGQSGSALFYALWDGRQWTRPAAVWSSPEGGAQQPALVAAGERLHAVWSGGPNGEVFYSRAFLRDAYAAGGWDEPRLLPAPIVAGAWPGIVAGPGGVLHIVYAVPVNEGRGIYYARSDDDGESWSLLRQVFDAAGAGWMKADHPRLAVDARGGLHAVWVRETLSGDGAAQGVYYAHSLDGGETWSEPFEIASGAGTWPEVAVGGLDQVHVVWSDTSQGDAWWHRRSADGGQTWTRSERVRGLEGVPGPVGLASDGAGRLYLVGLGSDDAGQPMLLHISWDGERWKEPERLRLELAEEQPGMSAALWPALGRLEVAFRGEELGQEGAGQAGLWYTSRAVPTVVVMPVPTWTPRPTATPLSTPTLVAIPSPTPDMGGSPAAGAGDGQVSLPLILGGGLAAAIVAGVFGARLLRTGG